MVLNQVHPSRCATSNPSQQGHLPGAWGCRHRRRQGFAANASLPDWLEGGGGPLANTSSQKPESLEHGQLKTQERQEHKSAMRHGNWWPGSARGMYIDIQHYILNTYLRRFIYVALSLSFRLILPREQVAALDFPKL